MARGRRYHLEVLNKSAIVLVTSFWEAYCEDIAAEGLAHIVNLRVVGVAANVKVDSLSESPAWQVYLPYTQTENFLVNFVARTPWWQGFCQKMPRPQR